jgi:hypothetical protein
MSLWDISGTNMSTTAHVGIGMQPTDALDVSGNVAVTNNLSVGNTVSIAGNTLSTSTVWTMNNMISSPPALTLNTSYAPTSSYIYISWTYPQQAIIGMLNLYLPLISAFQATWSGSVSGTVSSDQVILSSSTSNVIRYSGQTESPNYITGIVLTNINTGTGFTTKTFPGESSPRNVYVYYTAAFASLVDNSANVIKAWYSNYNVPNVATANYNIFVAAGAPSEPGTPSFGSQTADASGVSVVATTSAPTWADNLNQASSSAVIQNYKMVRYSVNSGSSVRYYGYVADASAAVFGSTTITLPGLHPDTSYNVVAYAQNNSTNTAYGLASTAGSLTTTYLPAPTTFGTLSFSGATNYTAKTVGSGSTVNNVFVSTPGFPWKSASIGAPIHYVATRGSVSTKLLTVGLDIVRGSTTVEEAIVQYGGYTVVLSNPAAYSSANADISTNTPTDYYSTNTSNPLAGYYLTAANTIALKSGAFVSSGDPTVVTVTHRQYAADGTTVNQTNASSYTYYYDASSNAAPSVSSVVASLRSMTSAQVCGVYVVYGTVGYNVTTTASHLGYWLYNSTRLLAYSTGQTETGLSNVASGVTDGHFADPVTIANASDVQAAYGSFATSAAITVTAYNVAAATAAATSAAINMVLDQPSYDLVYANASQYPAVGASTLGNGTNGTAGWRVSTAGNGGGILGLPPTSVYATTAYNNGANLTANSDLQIFNGLYQSKGTTTVGYLNYTAMYRSVAATNTVNYSGIAATGYRYATFAWKCNSNAVSYTNIQFTVNETTATVANPDTTPTVGSGTGLLCYYRVEDADNYGTFSGSYANSGWTNVCSTANPIGSTTYYSTASVLGGKDTSRTNTASGSSFTAYGILGHSLSVASGSNIYIYFRIGVPMNEDFGFKYVTAALS